MSTDVDRCAFVFCSTKNAGAFIFFSPRRHLSWVNTAVSLNHAAPPSAHPKTINDSTPHRECF